MPTALALHTSSPNLGLALSNFDDVQRQQTWDLGRALSTHLHDCLMAFLPPQTWADLDFLAVARGPGGFTGTRIGMVTARTLAQQLEIPLFAISSLAAVAHAAAAQMPDDSTDSTIDLAVQLSAQRGEVFGAIYRSQPQTRQLVPVYPDAVLTETDWRSLLDSWTFPWQPINANGDCAHTAADLLALAYADWQRGDRPHWSAALPFYGQHPVK
ncbi:tRNA (adenosine(37)-N6)-threonylcarbamoyltransferase complex dimerization subunit type 1 TsaB [Thermoleptolyngbya sp. M55_K2018_002]|uniref:tRNA (adenosine(37)-N6)-threonylcarbamoyltransferase complex dimerization subunit type 1 TsaB n=1 Tax=Thermoleptolyngbya sp. M55_K2018_002 TaxID=2747808 RepID=UPI0019F35505|nr:tRNA (adenosine(37)-N6)-threonylcarbamoyltransferase complex dimerization subunit type 1 TsaB [Thermoleptolyngbya sp. M55_K2018_002]HIK40536.1 tRNA (adenosine(37)-N6)-threonylcarbamoyltransferase complex dimerization subunit type 1 TsaB [Thermoleptolyngbya sp. M55_K2018_002]